MKLRSSNKRVVAPPTALLIVSPPRVILDAAEVDKYLKEQKAFNEMVDQFAMMSLDSGDGNDSVTFVAEENGPEGSSRDANVSIEVVGEEVFPPESSVQIRKMNAKMAKLRNQNRQLARRNITLQKQATIPTINISDDESEETFELSESFVENQVGEWQANGELPQILTEFKEFLNKNVKDQE